MWKDEVMIFNTGQGSLKGQDVKCIRRSKFFGKIWLRFLKYRFTKCWFWTRLQHAVRGPKSCR